MMRLLLLTLALPLALAQNGAVELGCFRDTGTRALSGKFVQGSFMTNQYCIDLCAKAGFNYAGTQYSSQCFCGNDGYDRYGAFGGKCTMGCAADKSQTCGGFWAVQVYDVSGHPDHPSNANKAPAPAPASDAAQNLGCFKDQAARALTGDKVADARMTPDFCNKFCSERGNKYAGVQYMRQCFCGNDGYNKYGASEGCGWKCAGDPSQTCGGYWAMQVYEVKPAAAAPASDAAQNLGCFKDQAARALTGDKVADARMTPDFCNKFCSERGNKYAAVQYMRECYCGNDGYNKYGASEGCGWKCAGDPSQTCGGYWAMQVYQVKPDPTEAPATQAPTEAPTQAPTEAPTEASVTCPKQRELFKENGIDVEEPALTEDCKFEPRQCNEKKCWCVKAKSGELDYKGVEFPASEDYNCAKKPKKCQRKVFKLLLSKKGKQQLPTCAKNGQYEPKQCNDAECWCVKPKGGKEKKNTRTSDKDSLKC